MITASELQNIKASAEFKNSNVGRELSSLEESFKRAASEGMNSIEVFLRRPEDKNEIISTIQSAGMTVEELDTLKIRVSW